MCKALFSRIRSPASLTFSCKCTILTSLDQAISLLSCHTCYKFCAFFHLSGQVSLLPDLGDNAFHSPPRRGANCRSTWDTRQATVSSVRVRVLNNYTVQHHLIKTKGWKLTVMRLREKRCSFKFKIEWKKFFSVLCPSLTSNPEGNGSEMITHFL